VCFAVDERSAPERYTFNLGYKSEGLSGGGGDMQPAEFSRMRDALLASLRSRVVRAGVYTTVSRIPPKHTAD
jgi:hypothetical protein